MKGGGTQSFTVAGLALRCKANVIELLRTCWLIANQEQMQFALNKKLEHCALQQSSSEHIPNQTAILYITLASRRKSDFGWVKTEQSDFVAY